VLYLAKQVRVTGDSGTGDSLLPRADEAASETAAVGPSRPVILSLPTERGKP